MEYDRSRLVLRLHGTYGLRWGDGGEISLKSAKARAMLAMLATSRDGKQARTTLQKSLWGSTDLVHQQASLRRCICELRKSLGERFDHVVHQDGFCVTLNQSHLIIESTLEDGAFLEDIAIRESGFLQWLEAERLRHGDPAKISDLMPANLGKPTVAVLPFVEVDPSSAKDIPPNIAIFFSQRLAQLLSRWQEVNLINPLALQQFELAQFDLAHLREQAHVDHIVHGTVSLGDQPDRFTLNLSLTDTRTGLIEDIEPVTGGISSALGNRTSILEDAASDLCQAISTAHATRKPLTTEADWFACAMAYLYSGGKQAFDRSGALFEQASIETDFDALHRTWYARWFLRSRAQQWADDPLVALNAARLHVVAALTIDPRNQSALITKAYLEMAKRDGLQSAKALFDEACFVNPRNPFALIGLGLATAPGDERDQALSLAQNARRLASVLPYRHIFETGYAWVALITGETVQAANAAARALSADRADLQAHIVRCVALARLGRDDEALRASRFMLESNPGTMIPSLSQTFPVTDWHGNDDIMQTLSELCFTGASRRAGQAAKIGGFAEDD